MGGAFVVLLWAVVPVRAALYSVEYLCGGFFFFLQGLGCLCGMCCNRWGVNGVCVVIGGAFVGYIL